MRRQLSRVLFMIAILAAVLLSVQSRAQTTELEQHLRDQYQDKTLLLRGFYSGGRLSYNAAGATTSGAPAGDWTTEGFVMVNSIQVADQRLIIKARRLFVAAHNPDGFHFVADTPKKRKKKAPFLEIEVDLGRHNPSPEQAAAALSKVFLTSQDAFADLVPDYWKPCVPQGLIGKDAPCRFPPEFMAIPGVASSAESNPAPPTSAGPTFPNSAISHVGKGVSPPKVIVSPEPKFSESARHEKYQGMVTLGVIVNTAGLPVNIRVLSPLGFGLDENAVRAVQTWKFKPSEKDGQPVPVEIAIEVDFHLY